MANAKRAAGKKGALKKKLSGLDLGKYLDDVRIGNFKLDDVLEGTSKNVQAIADANRAIVDGYIEIAKRQFEMLKDLLEDLKKVGGERSDMVKELKKVVEQARKDVQVLQKMASKTNSAAQRIVKKRSEANLKVWKKLVADAKKSLGDKGATAKKPAAKKKAAAGKKPVAKKSSEKEKNRGQKESDGYQEEARGQA